MDFLFQEDNFTFIYFNTLRHIYDRIEIKYVTLVFKVVFNDLEKSLTCRTSSRSSELFLYQILPQEQDSLMGRVLDQYYSSELIQNLRTKTLTP